MSNHSQYADPIDALKIESRPRGGWAPARLRGQPRAGQRRPRLRDTARAMSQENVEAFKRFADANNRRDVEAMLEELDPDVEWHSAILGSLGGDATVHRGHDGVREVFRDLYEAFSEFQLEFSEIRDLGDRIVAIGRWIARGEESGVETTPPLAAVVKFRNGKAIRVRSYLDPKDALEAVGLSE